MFSTRINQENDLYQQQRVAASKPQNQGLSTKTPFKRALKDENTVQKTAKGGAVKFDNFVTPAAPRDRAPLGNKTTNAKAVAFQTPRLRNDGKLSPVKQTSPRLRKSKIQVHQAEAVTQSQDEAAEEVDVEYAPPPVVPLPDYMDDWPLDMPLTQFEGRNFSRGWYSEFRDGDSDEESLGDTEEFRSRLQELQAKERQEREQKRQDARAAASKKLTGRTDSANPSTINSRAAVGALSSRSSHTRVPSFAASTASTRARSAQVTAEAPVLRNPRHTTAKVASNSTLGYNRGRVVSRAKQSRDDKSLDPIKVSAPKAPSAPPTSLVEIFGSTIDIEDVTRNVDDSWSNSLEALEEADDDFQLELPDL